jgi:hypothetical protein
MTRSLVLCALLAGCAAPGSGAELPLLSPPVRAAIPAGLQIRSAPRAEVVDAALDASALRDRFFRGSGPTDLLTLLAEVDQRLAEINAADDRPACLDQDPVRYTITPFGRRVTLSAQCFRRFEPSATGDAGFLQFGEQDGGLSLYVAIGTTRLAAIIAPIEGSTRYLVDAWYGIGYGSAADCGTSAGCAYAATQLYANPVTRTFEMAVAGLGVGYCGVQFGSDGSAIYGVGSIDAGSHCLDPAWLCASATDPGAPGTCGMPPAYVLPALGRRAGVGELAFGPSRYPAQPTITLDGSHTDSLHFGPLAPTDGAGDFDAR